MNQTNIASYYLDGHAPLWKAFWLWGVIVSTLLLFLFLFALDQIGVTWGLLIVSGIIMVPYTVWVLVAIWQCADNVRNDFWGRMARFVTILWSFNIGAVAGILLTELVVGWN